MNADAEKEIARLLLNMDAGHRPLHTLATAAMQFAYQDAARVAKSFNDFGPSTQCPKCGESGQVLHWYTIGREDAAEAIVDRAK